MESDTTVKSQTVFTQALVVDDDCSDNSENTYCDQSQSCEGDATERLKSSLGLLYGFVSVQGQRGTKPHSIF